MDAKLLNDLLHEEESATLDFKRDQYPFVGADDATKSELLKDVLAMANAWRRTDAYILIGVEDVRGGRSNPLGVTTHHDDATLQQFVNLKTNRPIKFSYEAAAIGGQQIGIIRIDVQERPFFLKKDYGKLKAATVYVRRGSSTDIADPDEIHRMGAASAREKTPQIEENLKVRLNGFGAATSPPPYNTGEPLHFVVELVIINAGTSPIFIVSAKLMDANGKHAITFSDVCNETDPLQPGGRRKSTMPLLYHQPFLKTPRHARTTEALREQNHFEFRLLRFICQEGSLFQIETGRGTALTYPARDVCGDEFLRWPAFAPQSVLDELGSKTLEDFDEETRVAFENAGICFSSESQAALSVEVRDFSYQDSIGDGMSISPYPRCFVAELALTNNLERPLFIREFFVAVGSRTYTRPDGMEVLRMEAGEYKELQVWFPVEDGAAIQSGPFALEIVPAVGKSIRVAGTIPSASFNS
jgi:hypothetical protein